MKNHTINLLLLLAASLISGACQKELNVFPTVAEVDGNLITDQQSAQTVLNGVYYRFADASATTGILSTQWASVNEYVASGLAGSVSSPLGTDSTFNFTFTPDNNDISSIWQYCYDLVNAADGFIRNAAPATTLPAAAKQQMLAEAAFLRAFGNSQLLLYFAQYDDPSSKYGIILRDTFVTAANVYTPRSGVAAAYTSILTDLDQAIQGLPVLNSAIYYTNASTARLLKARVLMNRGAAGDYAEVISLTNDIITNGPFALEDSLKDIFLTKGLSSQEVMLGIQPYQNETYKYFIYQTSYGFQASDSLVSLLADDARNQWVYKFTPFFTFGYNELTKYYSGDPIAVSVTPLSVYCYAFRLSEAYLLEAEAITFSGGSLTTAKTLLTTVMSHAGAGTKEIAAVENAATPAALQLEIVKETLRNFVCENGVDWFALRRLPFSTIQMLNPKIPDPTKLIFPIPSFELSENDVIQNPGY